MRQIVREDRTPSVGGKKEKQSHFRPRSKCRIEKKGDEVLDLRFEARAVQVVHCVVLKRKVGAELEVVQVCL